jgi:hypothetical protein
LVFSVLALDDSVCAQSGCTNPPPTGQWWAPNTQITVWIDPSFGQQAYFNERNKIVSAVTAWSNQPALANNNITLVIEDSSTPDPGPNAANVIRVVDNPSGSQNHLAWSDTIVYQDLNGQSTGQMFNGTISFNREFMLDPTTPAYDPADFDSLQFFQRVFEHEFGHEVGCLNDMLAPNDDPCLQTPGASIMNGYCGTNDSGGILPSSITPCDNDEVNQIQSCHQPVGGCLPGYYWDEFFCDCIYSGPPPPPPEPCGGLCTCGAECMPNGQCGPLPDGCSPIIIAVGQSSNYQLTSAAEGVLFDMNADGIAEPMAWTRAGEPVAFLVLDRNGNGRIDNGGELFGNHSVLPSGQPVTNGFEALAYYDQHSGNGDGVVDSRDGIWASLRLWIDWNHDGISQEGELYRMEDWLISSVSLQFQTVNRRDGYGNVYRLRAPCQLGQRTRFGYDVYFSMKPQKRPN